jgi:hypothetical protein
VPARIVIGFDGTDSGEDALALGLVLARATRAVPLVVVVHPQEYPIGAGRVDAEWVAFPHTPRPATPWTSPSPWPSGPGRGCGWSARCPGRPRSTCR